MPVTSSIGIGQGVRNINGTHLMFSYEDLAGKLQILISAQNALVSAVSQLNTSVSQLQTGALCAFQANASLFSAYSGGIATSTIVLGSFGGTLSNFTL